MNSDFRINLKNIDSSVFTTPDTYLFAVPDIILVEFVTKVEDEEVKIETDADITDFVLLLSDLTKKNIKEGSAGFVHATLTYQRTDSSLKLRVSAGKERVFEQEIREEILLNEIKNLVSEFLSSIKTRLPEEYPKKLLEYWKKGSREDWPRMAKVLGLESS